MIAIVARALYWLLCAMTAPQPPIPDLPPVQPRPAPREPNPVEQWRIDEHHIEGGWYGGEWPRLWPPRQQASTGDQPCWACGDPAGFFAEHLPCSNVPPFRLTSPTLPDGSTYRRTP